MGNFISSVIIDLIAYLATGLAIDWYRGRYTDPENFTMTYLSGLAERHPEWNNKEK